MGNDGPYVELESAQQLQLLRWGWGVGRRGGPPMTLLCPRPAQGSAISWSPCLVSQGTQDSCGP